ncbi:XdhC family protein [Roseateles sp. BYS180W]|uniref:XdhC family protein n=1 Tax=Roseateles rivi TaxID=3299028 RepID=A0ABW7FQV8_9BURK
MDNVDVQVLRQAQSWLEQGFGGLLATVVRTWGSAPRPVGALMALREDGLLAGSVSGGCIEDDLVAQMRQGGLQLERPQHLRYGVGAQEAQAFGLPCGGTLELLLEPLGPHTRVAELLALLAQGQMVCRELNLASGAVQLHSNAEGRERVQLSDTQLITHHGPQWRLLIIGAGQLSQYLAPMALALDYQVLVCDPRTEHDWQASGVQRLYTMPDDAVLALRPDAHTAVVALTHDPKLDDLALLEALRSPAFYVGALGSRANQAKRRARLAEHFGLSPAELDRLHGPVGLAIGARTPPEIAVSILAELTAKRYGVST